MTGINFRAIWGLILAKLLAVLIGSLLWAGFVLILAILACIVFVSFPLVIAAILFTGVKE